MANFTITIKLGNDAMQTSYDVAEALTKIAQQLDPESFTPLAELIGTDRHIFDLNGNEVGRWMITE